MIGRAFFVFVCLSLVGCIGEPDEAAPPVVVNAAWQLGCGPSMPSCGPFPARRVDGSLTGTVDEAFFARCEIDSTITDDGPLLSVEILGESTQMRLLVGVSADGVLEPTRYCDVQVAEPDLADGDERWRALCSPSGAAACELVDASLDGDVFSAGIRCRDLRYLIRADARSRVLSSPDDPNEPASIRIDRCFPRG